MKMLDKNNWPILTALLLLGALLPALRRTRLQALFRRVSEADLHEIIELVLDPAWEEPPKPAPEDPA